MRHPLRLLTQQAKEVRRFRKHVGVLGGKQLKLSLHKRKRSAKFVGGISGELPLGGKALVKTVEHTVERYAELSKLRQSFLGNLHICQVIRLHFFYLSCKGSQRLQRTAADEICQHAADKRHRRRNIPVSGDKGILHAVYDNSQLLIGLFLLRIEKAGLSLLCVAECGNI